MLDRENQSEYTIVVGVSDGLFENTLNINIIVNDVNDNVPTPLESLYAVSVVENVPIGTVILNIVFDDPDEGDNAVVLFNLTVLTPHNYTTAPFAVFGNGTQTGYLVTLVEFDFEQITVTQFDLVVLGYNSDGQGNTTMVTITILDENDNIPMVTIIDQMIEYLEGMDYVSLPSIAINDPDTSSILCANVILQDPVSPLETLFLASNASIPSGFVIEFMNNILYIAGRGTPDDYSMTLSNVRYSNPEEEFNGSLTRNITIMVADRLNDDDAIGSGSSVDFKNISSSVDLYGSDSLTITLVPLNDPPVITCAPVALNPIDEDDMGSSGESVRSLFAQLISDNDNSDFGIAVIQSPMESVGQLQQINTNSGSFALRNASITSAYLLGPDDLLQFVPATNINGNFSFQFLAWDGTGNFTSLDDVNITAFSDGQQPFSNTSCVAYIIVNPVNDPPVIELGGVGILNISRVYVEGLQDMITSIDIAPNASVSDVDADRYLERLVVNISSLEYGCEAGINDSMDVIYCINMSSIPIISTVERYGPSCIAYTFEGRHTIAEWRAVIQSCKFRIDDPEPSGHTRLLEYTVDDREDTSSPAYAIISVQLQNDNCPELSSNGERNLMDVYVEHSGSVVITGTSLQLADRDGGMIESAQVTITPTGVCRECVLRVNTSSTNIGITQSFDQLTLNITGPASIAEFEAVLQTLEFEDRANEPDVSNVNIIITVNDGDNSNCQPIFPTNMISIRLMIIVINDQAAIFYPNGGNEATFDTVFMEGSNPVPIVGIHAVIVDDDFIPDTVQSINYTMTVSLEVGCGASDLIPAITMSTIVNPYNPSTCSVTFSGSAGSLETDLMQIRFSSDSRNPNPLLQRVRFTLQDFNLTTYSTTEVAILTVNDPPAVDLNVTNTSNPNANIIYDISAGVTSVTLVGSMGSSITDVDNDYLQSLTFTLQEFSNNMMIPRTDGNLESIEPPSNLMEYGLSSSGFSQLTNVLVINGPGLLENFTAALDAVVYQNLQPNPTPNVRRITIVASDGNLTSVPVRATILFAGENHPPMLENIPTENVKYFINDPPMAIAPDIFINEPDGDLICTAIISGTCDFNNFDFSDIMYPDLISFDNINDTLVLRTTPFSCLLSTTFSSILRSVKYFSSNEGICTMTIQVTEDRGLVSNVENIFIETLTRNSPPRVDNDLGARGTGFATQYLQGVTPVHIVSIFNATLSSTISPQFFEGEAMGEVGEAPSANESSIPTIALSHAGYLLEDDDNVDLVYLRATIVNSSTSVDDVLVFPCINPSSTDDSIETARGCDNRRTSRVVGGRNMVLQYSPNVTTDCNQGVDICSGLRVEITCPYTGYKRYTFTYTNGNSSVVRFRALLGCIGYEYLVEVGGYLNHERCIDVSAYDGTDISNVATTKVQLLDSNRLIFNPSKENISICEGEKPSEKCIQFVAQPRLVTGQLADLTTVKFTIVSGNADNKFAINDNGGVYLINSLDRETQSNYTLIIRAVNLIGEATLTLCINVEDVNDNHPIIAQSFKASVPEGIAGAVVIQLNATDKDEGSNADLMYFIVGYGSDMFTIDSNGVIRTSEPLDTGEMYMLVVIVTDRGDIIRYRNDTYRYTDNNNGGLYLSSHTIVAVDVTLRFLPTIMITPNNVNVSVMENTNLGMVLTSFVAENNETSLSNNIQYAITSIVPSNPPGAFVVKETSPGNADVTTNAILDAELVTGYVIMLTAFNTSTDQVNPGNALLAVSVIDQNDNVPQFIDVPNTIILSEDYPLNRVVFSFMVFDNDISNTSFTFDLSGSFTFAIATINEIERDRSLTNVSIALNRPLDYDTQPSGYLNITVFDSGAPVTLSNSTIVNIIVLDVNDNPPVFLSDPTRTSVIETASNGTLLLNISTIFTDMDTVGDFIYFPTMFTSVPFCIDNELLVVCQPDILTSFEQNSSYTFNFSISNPPLAPVNVSVIVDVQLVNEFPPRFTSDVYNFSVPENSAADVSVGSVMASDNDGGNHGMFNFFANIQDLPFLIDDEMGNITTDGEPIDRENISFYSFQVNATDNPLLDGDVQFTTVTMVNVYVEDLNDNAPVFVGAPYYITTMEHTSIGTTLLQFTIIDQDTPSASTLQVSLPSGVPFNLFSNGSYVYTLVVNDSDALDYDAGPQIIQFNITANDMATRSGDESHEVVATVTITLININDFPPVINGPQQLFVNEISDDDNIVDPILIGEINATDIDMNVLMYEIDQGANCTEDVPFAVNFTTGEILLCRRIDYEQRTNYSLTVVVSDGVFSVNSTISVQVVDRNDNPPTFPEEPIQFIVSENASMNMFIGAIAHDDNDSLINSMATYTGLNVPEAFRVSSSGRLFINNASLLDQEMYPSSYMFVVLAENTPYDPTDETQLANVTIIISVTDINEHPPEVERPCNLYVEENVPIGYPVGRINVTDPDPSAVLYYVFLRESDNTEITECTSFFPFQIGPTTGIIATCNAIDYEETPRHRLVINVTDGLSSVIGECTVTIIDINDIAPVISPANVTLRVSELETSDSLLSRFDIIDGDSSEEHRIITSSTVMPSSAPFYLLFNNSDLSLLLNNSLDYESTRSYTLQIFVNNEGLNSRPAMVEVIVVNENDLQPRFNLPSFNLSVFENVTGLYELLTVIAVDPDMITAPITYDIDPGSVPFVMDGNTLVVANQTVLDYDNGIRVYRFNITATDSPVRPNGTQLTAYLPGEVHVLDVNDNAPEFDNNSLKYMVGEDAMEGVFGRVRVMDDDSGENMIVTFSKILPDECLDDSSGSGSGSGMFSICSECCPFMIDPVTGELTLCGELDFERSQNYTFMVVAMDMGSPPMSSTATVCVEVVDVNDNSPEILNRRSLQNFSLMENETLNSHVAFINATDADSGENSRLVYETQILNTYTNCTDQLPFTINENGYLILCRTLDYEIVTMYSFYIVVYDSGNPVLNDTVSVTVTILNVNDNEPVIESNATASIIEEQPNIFVIDVEASDPDAPEFPIISYQLSGESFVNFTINETTGEIRTRNSIDREVQDRIMITVFVFDQNFNVSQDITVFIIDINDNDPAVLSNPSVNITENTETTIAIIATDSDAGNNSLLTFSLVNASNSLGYYSINYVTGELTIQPLDRDPGTGGIPRVTVDINVTDSGSPPRGIIFTQTINIVDVNDNTPLFLGAATIELDEGTPNGTVVFTVTATDYDEGSNANLTYSVIDGTAPLDFVPGTPQLEVAEVPIFIDPMRFLLIQIQDWSRDASNRSMILINLTVIIQSPSPRFPEDIVFMVDENSNGTLGTAQATVRGMVQLLNYTIVQELPFGDFAIDNNGSISAPNCCLDYEDAENYTLEISATVINDLSFYGTTDVDIVLDNINEHAPILFPVNLTGTIDENAYQGARVAKALAIDLDFGPGGYVSYIVNDSSVFMFDNATGCLEVFNPDGLDHENQSEYILEYRAVDGGTPAKYSETGYITIGVANIDDVPPRFTMSIYRATINETVNIGFPVLTVSATDIDTSQQDLVYSLYPPQTDFGIHPSLGIIVTESLLDHETTPVYEFSIVVTDTQGLNDTAIVSIILFDNNDNRPSIRPNITYIINREEDRYVSFPQNILIENLDNTAKFPVVSVTASLRSANNLSFPLPGGFCDHANYSRLYQSSTAKLCDSGADNLIDFADPLDLAEPGILDLEAPRKPNVNLIVIGNRPVTPQELQPGFCLCMWLNIPSRFKSIDAGQQLFRFNPIQGQLAPLRLLIRNNVFEVGYQNMVNNEDFTELITVPLNDDAYPNFIDGTWHHLCVNYNGSAMSLHIDGELVSSNNSVTIPSFSNEAIPLLGELLSGFVSQLYFQPGEMCSSDILMCLLTCGEWLDVDNATDYEDVMIDLNYHERSVTITYTGDDNANSTSRLEAALRSIEYFSILDEPHPLDRNILIEASDMVGSGDPSYIVAVPDLINDQRPVLDVNGPSNGLSGYQTTYIEDSPGIQIISPDAVLYDRDSGYWEVSEISISIAADMSNNINGILGVVGTLQAPLQATVISSTSVIINATDGSGQYPELFLDALMQVVYSDPEEEPSSTTIEIIFLANDGIFTGPKVSTTVTIQPANDPPIIDLNVIDLQTLNNSNTFNEQLGEVRLISDNSLVNISDIDGSMLSGALITITNRPDGVQEFLSIDDNLVGQFLSITAQSYNSDTGELRLSGIGSFNDYLSLLRQVRYHNEVPGSPNIATRLISFVVFDGSDPTSGSIPAYIFMAIELFNDAPIIYLDGMSSNNFNFTYVEDSNCVVLFPNATVFDLDNTELVFSRVMFSGASSPNELIMVTNTSQVTVISFAGRFLLRLNQNATIPALQAFQEVYRNILYCNNDDEPQDITARTVTIMIQEGVGNSLPNSVTATITIMLRNDLPIITITRQDEAAVRNESVPIIDVDSFDVDDSDDLFFNEMIIIIVNPQNSEREEIIDFEDIRLPTDTFIQGPNTTGRPYVGYQYFVEFRGSGADFNKLRNTIAVLGYRNTAPASVINTDVPRNICIVIRDFEEFSPPACVSVTISPINQFTPVFVNSSGITLNITETNDPVIFGFVSATDDDTDLAGVVRYSVSVYDSNGEIDGLVGIDIVNGSLFSLAPLDAEMYRQLLLTVSATDQGNPQRRSRLNITLFIDDENDVPPELSVIILVDIVDGQGNGLRVAEITATDGDATSPNNVAITFSIVSPLDINGIPLFNLDVFSNGRAVDLVLDGIADREVNSSYFVNISVTDSGTPSITTYQLIEFSITDTNDQRPVIRQLIEGRYVIGSNEPTSIGPVLRIIDSDESPVIQSVQITLIPSAIDLGTTFSNCPDQRCQSERMQECGLIRAGSFDIIRRSEFRLLFENTSSTTGCNSVRLTRGVSTADGSDASGLGVLDGSNFAANSFVNFTIIFVATQVGEGFPFVINSDVNEEGGIYPRYLALWIRRRRFNFFYSYFTSGGTRVFSGVAQRDIDIFDRDNIQRRHIAVVVQGTSFKIYLNCREVVDMTLEGIIADPPPEHSRMEIGYPDPTVLRGGRFEGDLSDYYFHSYSMSAAEVLCTCSCGSEQLVLPNSLPAGITGAINSDLTRVTLTANPPISLPIMEGAIRDVGYINTFSEPDRSDPRRQLDFFLSDGDNLGSESPTDQYVLLVDADDNTPIITITGDTSFVEDFEPIRIISDASITRQDGRVPPIFNMTVTLLNPLNNGEQLFGENTSVVTVTGVGTTMLTLSGPATPGDYIEALRMITYFNPADIPDTSSVRQIKFCANGQCSPSRAEVTVLPTNDNPVIIYVPLAVSSYTEGSDPVLFASALQIDDVDGSTLSSAQVLVRMSPEISKDVLGYSSISLPNGLQITPLSNYSINITGTGLISAYQDILRSITFSSSSNPLLDNNGAPTVDVTRTVVFVVTDSDGGTSTPTNVDINFVPVNSPPEILTTGLAVFQDNVGSIFIDPNATIIDEDNDRLLNLSVQLVGASSTEALRYTGLDGSSLNFDSDSRAALINILRSVRYFNLEDEPELRNRTVLITVCDFSSCAVANLVIMIRDVNDINPMFTRPSFTAFINENSPIGTTVLTVAATDADRGQSIFSFAINDMSVPFNIRKTQAEIADIEVSGALDFEASNIYEFSITVNDGGEPELEGISNVTIFIVNVNERPTLDLSGDDNSTFNQIELTRFVPSPGTSVNIFGSSIVIADIDAMDGISEARICIIDYQPGDRLFLSNNITVLVLNESSGGCLTITRTSADQMLSAEDFEQLLENNVRYQRENVVEDGIVTVLRNISAEVRDNDGLVSNTAYLSLSLANLPEFDQTVYVTNLTEGVSHANFLAVMATVEGEAALIQYELQDIVTHFISITSDSGVLSLTNPLDYEYVQQVTFEVYAIDPIPPARTATATVMINVIDINDNPPNATFLGSNVTVNSDGTIDVDIVLSDNDTFPLSGVVIELRADVNVSTNPFTLNTCLDVYDAFQKMGEACGLSADVEDLIAASVSNRNDSRYSDEFGNEYLRNFYLQSYARVYNYSIDGLQNSFTELTFAVWISIFRGQSGYIISTTNYDGSERYFSVYFNANKRQIIVYLKDPNNSGRSSILSVVFQLQFNLDDTRYHFMMIYVQNGEVELVIDRVRITTKLYYSFNSRICSPGK